MICQTCKKKYIGQAAWPFHVRFREHFQDYKYANNKSKSAQHLLEEGHSFGPIDDVMDAIHMANKCRMLDTIERFYIYWQTQRNNRVNDKLTVRSNSIFEALVQRFGGLGVAGWPLVPKFAGSNPAEDIWFLGRKS